VWYAVLANTVATLMPSPLSGDGKVVLDEQGKERKGSHMADEIRTIEQVFGPAASMEVKEVYLSLGGTLNKESAVWLPITLLVALGKAQGKLPLPEVMASRLNTFAPATCYKSDTVTLTTQAAMLLVKKGNPSSYYVRDGFKLALSGNFGKLTQADLRAKFARLGAAQEMYLRNIIEPWAAHCHLDTSILDKVVSRWAKGEAVEAVEAAATEQQPAAAATEQQPAAAATEQQPAAAAAEQQPAAAAAEQQPAAAATEQQPAAAVLSKRACKLQARVNAHEQARLRKAGALPI